MSSIHYAHHRTTPPSARKSFVKTARLASSGAPKVSFKGNGKIKQTTDKPKEKESEVQVDDEDDDDMAISFPQFWSVGLWRVETSLQKLIENSTTCDRQILVPKTSLLYCSERCKRIDAEYIPDYMSLTSPTSATSGEETDSEILGPKNRGPVERAMPTPRPVLSARTPPKVHEGKSDLDPTEWKPKLTHRPTSDASKYLGQFHRTPPTSWSPRRPAAIHAQSTSSVPLNAPSLSATPSASSTSSDDSVAGTPYNFANRPSMHSNSTAIKSVNLVTPHAPAAYSVPAKSTGQAKLSIKVTGPPAASVAAAAAENIALAGDLSYEKKWNLAHFRGSGSLTTLLGGASLEHNKAAM
ncbi:MAG: hypothetical protein Q9225_000596 [Loekoesia sp. 1 TL-2023]